MRKRAEGALLASLVGTILAVSVGLAGAVCVGEGPDAVLDCYSAAYSDRDIGALNALLADDYTWIAVTYPRAEVMERDELMQANRSMCGSERVEFMSLTFTGDYEVVDGWDEGTWRIEGLVVTMSVKAVDAEEAHSTSVCLTLYVREVDGAERAYEIYREVTFEGGGCDR